MFAIHGKTTAALVALLLLCTFLTPFCSAKATYTILDDYTASPEAFFESFDFFTDADPTNGYVAYVDPQTAGEGGLIGYVVPDTAGSQSAAVNASSIYIGVDHTNVITSGSGRPSVRITGKTSYNASTLLIADILHMPTGCGTWSSLWMLGGVQADDWPVQGELDIIENVNLANANMVTLHTNAGCAVDNNTVTSFTGTMMTSNCDVNAIGQGKNQGCTVQAPTSSTSPSFGAAFNSAGGGVYAVEWTTAGFSIWFFGRSASMPESLLTDSPDPSTFGTPIAQFGGTGCDFEQHFQDMSIILDTTFCGDWAGEVWESGGCAASTGTSTCEAFVAAEPAQFEQAYWEIRGLRVYEQDGVGNNNTVVGRSLPVDPVPPSGSQQFMAPLVIGEWQSNGMQHGIVWLVFGFALLLQVVSGVFDF